MTSIMFLERLPAYLVKQLLQKFIFHINPTYKILEMIAKLSLLKNMMQTEDLLKWI